MMSLGAPRGSGKSFLTRMMLQTIFQHAFDHFIIICPSLEVNDDYDDFRKDKRFVFMHTVTERQLDAIFDHLYTVKKKVIDAKRFGEGTPTKRCPRTLIIFDDCVDSGLINFRGPVDKFAQRGRHINTSVMVLAQGITSISSHVRRNSDMFIIFRPFNMKETEKFLEENIPKEIRKQTLEKLYMIFDKEYHFVIVNNHATSMDDRLRYSIAQLFVQNVDYSILDTDPVSEE